jgi:conjugal transfer pilus assembly protein TraB
MIVDIKQNIKKNNRNDNLKNNTNQKQENLYKNFPPPPSSENPKDYGVNRFGKVPQINKKIVVKNTILNDSLVYQSIAQPEKKSKKQNKEIQPLKILSTGTITKVTLLGGMDAPTMAAAKTNPLPVLMRVDDLSFLPNNWRYNMNGCFILGEGYGDLSSERAYIRTTTLSCVTKDGYHIDTPFKGAVYGEDGKAGLRGRVVTKQGAMLARTLVAGFLQGISEAFKQSNTIVSVSPTGTTQAFDPKKAMQTGMFSGASKATEKLADFYLKMADQIAPIIEISAGRRVNVIATDRIELKPLETMTKKGKK